MNHDDSFPLSVGYFIGSSGCVAVVVLIALFVLLTGWIITSLLLVDQVLGSFKAAILRVGKASESIFNLQRRNPDGTATA